MASSTDDELAAFIDRILRMKAEEDAIKSDIREIYAEAKGRGYDKTRLGETVATVRKLEKDADGEAEKEALRDLYLTAYYRAKNKPHTHAHARTVHVIAKKRSVPAGFDAETGEQIITHSEVVDTVPADVRDAEDLTVAQAPTAGRQVTHSEPQEPGIALPPAQMPAALAVLAVPAESSVPTSVAGQEGIADQHLIAGSSNGRTTAFDAANAGSTPAPASNITTLRPAKPIRPNCLKRDHCGASGLEECYLCRKAAAQSGAA